MSEDPNKARIRRNVEKMRAQGAADDEVEDYLSRVEGLKPVADDAPGVLARAGAQISGFVRGLAPDKIGDTAAAMVMAPVESFRDAVLASGEAERESEASVGYAGNRGGPPVVVPRIGAPVQGEGVSAKRRREAGVQSMFNVAAPGIASGARALAVRLGAGRGLSGLAALESVAVPGGAVYSPDDPAAGMVANAILAPAVGRVGQVMGGAGRRAAGAALDAAGRPAQTRVVRIAGREVARIEGQGDRARSRIAERQAQDATAGAGPNVSPHRSLPAIVLDRHGPNVQSLVEGIAHRQGPGQAVVRSTLEGRQAQMRPAVTRAFDEATATTAESGANLIRRLADEHTRLDTEHTAALATRERTVAADRTAHAAQVRAARDANRQPQPQPDALSAWRETLGGEVGGGTRELARLLDQKNAVAREAYGKARASRSGDAEIEAVVAQLEATPAGKTAMEWARARQANRAGGDVIPDMETLHLAKQFLAKQSRLGVHDGQGGTVAVQAESATRVWERARGGLSEPWRLADEATAAQFSLIDAHNLGRDLMRTQLNPRGRAASRSSLDAIEQEFGGMTPEQQQAYRVGAQGAVTDFLRTGGAPARLAVQLREPTSAMSRRVALATGNPDAPAQLAARLAPPPRPRVEAPARPAPPPKPERGVLAPESEAATTGLDVLRYRTAPPANQPHLGLAVLDDVVSRMGAGERGGFQRGAAQAARGAWEGASGNVKSPGRVFDFESPESAAQIKHAFPDEATRADFRQAVRSWDAAQAQRERVLGNAATARRGAEGTGAGASLTTSAQTIARGLIERVVGKLRTRNQQALEGEVARILMSPDLQALPVPDRAASIYSAIARLATGHGGRLLAPVNDREQSPP